VNLVIKVSIHSLRTSTCSIGSASRLIHIFTRYIGSLQASAASIRRMWLFSFSWDALPGFLYGPRDLRLLREGKIESPFISEALTQVLVAGIYVVTLAIQALVERCDSTMTLKWLATIILDECPAKFGNEQLTKFRNPLIPQGFI